MVTGATGSIGRHLVRLLQRDGVAFRALVRDEAKGRALGCDYVVGDLGDPASIDAALRGADRLFLNSTGAQPVDGEQPVIRLQKNAIDAAARAGVDHIVKVSVWHANEGGLLSEGAHWEIERHLASAGPGWSTLQPGGFMQNFLGYGSFTAAGELINPYGDTPVSYIDCLDIAACGAALLTGAYGKSETYVLTGPEAVTHAQIAGKLSAVLGRVVPTLEMGPQELAANVKSQGVPARFADDFAGLLAKVANGAHTATTSAVRDLTGRPARDFDAFLADNRPAFEALLPAPGTTA
ncbi:NAD(P)-dependent oxidoreductase [Sinosporangium siamense]|uniref:NAD(P)-dependent oxidoreductase n=1 Tax=Sinosporangium siamense TaxID=1367973 RepID=A0A919RLZ3_9ACTN|nr:NAD(P)-dependent oxidoreductase [Sinosporangium siamense]